MVSAAILIPIIACIFGVFYLFFTTRNRERMAMIDKGADPAIFTPARVTRTAKSRNGGSGLKFTLKSGMLIIGIGVGFVISVLFNGMIEYSVYPLLVIGIIFICGGTGLVAGFYMGRNLEKKEMKE